MQLTEGPHLGLGWQLIGGHLAADLVNTVTWRRDERRRSDKLLDSAHLADWFGAAAQAHDLPADSTSPALRDSRTDSQLGAVRGVSEGPAEVLTAQVDHGAASGGRAPAGRSGAWRRAVDAATMEPGLPLRHTLPVRVAADDR